MNGVKQAIKSVDVHGNEVEYPSFASAGRDIGLSPNLIRSCVIGIKPTAGNRIWMYSNDEYTTESLEVLKSTGDKFVERAYEVHGDLYTYADKPRVWHDSVAILCNRCGCTFKQKAHNHVNGNGCSVCASSGFKDYLPAILYYLKITYLGNTGYKIGITNRTVEDRFRANMKGHITLIKTWDFASGKDARDMEAEILKNFEVYRWRGVDLLTDGNTELFDRDVLELDEVKNG